MPQTLKGKIVSNIQAKTVIVEVVRLTKHARYGKYMRTSKRYKAHTEESIPMGSTVTIQSTRPISRDKRWRVLEVLSQKGSVSPDMLLAGDEISV